MLKEALTYLIGLGNTRMENVDGQVFSTQPLHPVKEATPSAILVHSLSGMIEYLKSKFDGDESLMVHVKSPTEVEAFSTFNRDYNRRVVIKAEAMLPQFNFGNFHDPENFIIKLQSAFVKNEDRDIILKVVGNIKEESVQSYGDDGISQTVTAKTGVAQVGTVLVPNPVSLQPYRTFVEVEQPVSNFIFRMQSGPRCAFFESDGGAWKQDAMTGIKSYLEAALEEEITAGKIVIIA